MDALISDRFRQCQMGNATMVSFAELIAFLPDPNNWIQTNPALLCPRARAVLRLHRKLVTWLV